MLPETLPDPRTAEEQHELEWPTPGTIESNVPPVPTLPPAIIPEPYRAWLSDVSHRMQTPPDLPTISAIVISSSLIGAGCAIRPKARDGWEVIPNLWGGCVGRPSVVLKSPSMKEAMRLLERLQADYGRKFEDEEQTAQFDDMAREFEIEAIKGKLKAESKKDKADAQKIDALKAEFIEAQSGEQQQPTRRLLKTNETSVQSMTSLQQQNPRGLLVFRDELTALLSKWDTDSGADERAYFLEGWNGDGSYTDYKIGRGLTDAKSICISMLGGIQPDKLKRYMHQAQKGGNDGLVQRLQLAVWPDEPVNWTNVDKYPDSAAKDRAFQIFEKLAEMDFIQHGAEQGEHDDRPFFHFSDDAQQVFNDWLTNLQTVKLRGDDSPLMVEHFGKYRSLMPSRALIFHLIEMADNQRSGPVSSTAALLAVEWCNYLEMHARRIYSITDNPENQAAVRLADKIREGKIPSPFKTRIVTKKGWHGLNDMADLQPGIDILLDSGWLRVEIKESTSGRPPAPEYTINPVFSGTLQGVPAKPAKRQESRSSAGSAGFAGGGGPVRESEEVTKDEPTESGKVYRETF